MRLSTVISNYGRPPLAVLRPLLTPPPSLLTPPRGHLVPAVRRRPGSGSPPPRPEPGV
ncbi:hypothetical protein ACIBRY_33135 [Streptomyces anulatus]